ncbi:twin-arginine translocase TatA/TatE family subunit [uncultured Chloroflexus sp.]|uniref:twin-arginine translocase TatA/TatE family subunit n=1 Tax=uncultured Chloroflexus sp. TaxID=214040 RepID=UPI00260F04AD|nr:twin-arginine translocase TatA/TatE family subunit [uncultured Chloroflexus sp.]
MEIFNVHLPELILIAGLALVLFGPERLPELGRFAGKQVAKFLAWQQQSPELQMINEMRNEFEREIAQLRDELVRTRNQLDVRNDVQAMVDEVKAVGEQVQTTLNEALPAAQPTLPPPDAAPPAQPTIRPPAQAPIPAAMPVEPVTNDGGVAQPITDEDRMLFADVAAPAATAPAQNAAEPVTPAEISELLARLNGLAAELQSIVLQLQARGLLDQHWQPTVAPAPVSEETVTP